MKEQARIDKILANLGYGTRKEIKQLIKEELVIVNDTIIKDPGTHVNPYVDKIYVGENLVTYRKYIYLMLNKPSGVISATYDQEEKTVIDLLREEDAILQPFPVGRLDKDTEGLLILTNDGELAHQLISPKKKVPKVYYVEVSGELTEDDITKVKEGIVLDDGYLTLPGDLKIITKGSFSQAEITIYEGKFHQVKRMFKALGKKVTYLQRIRMGNLLLDESLMLGDYRELTVDELNLLKGPNQKGDN